MTPLRIYLADLTHIGNGIATEAFPLNVGLIASYANKVYGKQVDLTLFKHPDHLKRAILECPPHIMGCSNYTWNSNLSYYFCQWLKSIDRNILTVWGGTNYPFDPVRQEEFLAARPDLDVHVFYEGEHAFANIIERVLSVSSRSEILAMPIAGCQFIDRKTGQFASGQTLPRIRELDTVPSPYVTGLLDKFFDGHLTPLVETARGCPFTCNYCNAANAYYNHVNQFSNDYVREELTYIAKQASQVGVGHLTIVDNNFGMLPRDSVTVELLHDLQQKYGWPRSISAWTGKNSKGRVIEATRLLGKTLSISMSVQSMDQAVLKNIGRSNIRLNDYRSIAADLNAQGRLQHAEVIMPLPGETMESHIKGLNDLLDTGVSRVSSHQLQMLHGTPYKDDSSYVKTHAFLTKYRVVPLDFSRIDDKYVFDVEQIAVASNTFPFDEYLQARKYLLVIDLCFSSGVCEPLKKYLSSRNVKNSEWVRAIYDKIGTYPPEIKQVFDSFERETISELWDTEDTLIRFYSLPENYEKLIAYEMGGNVLFKHRIWMLSKASEQWIGTVLSCGEELMLDRSRSVEESRLKRELEALKSYIHCSVVDCFSPQKLDEPLEKSFNYDIPSWLKQRGPVSLADFAVMVPVTLKFYFPSNVVAVMRDAFKRYGTDIAGLTKMVQRTASISYVREVSYQAAPHGFQPATVAGGVPQGLAGHPHGSKEAASSSD